MNNLSLIKNFQEILRLIRRAFVMVKYNMALTLPFLLFWLILGFMLTPMGSGGGAAIYALLLFVGLLAAFLSGWFNMFKKCTETSVDQNEPNDKRVSDPFYLYKEFFPGVGKYFTKIILGIVMIFLLFNILMFMLEVILMPMLATFDSFSREEMGEALKGAEAITEFWGGISDSDKAKLIKIIGIEFIFSILFIYLTMFWAQLVILEENYPIKTLKKSVMTIIKDPARTSIIFFGNAIFISVINFISIIMAMNPLIKLVFILLLVYAFIFYVMMTFLYLERYGEIESSGIDITIEN